MNKFVECGQLASLLFSLILLGIFGWGFYKVDKKFKPPKEKREDGKSGSHSGEGDTAKVSSLTFKSSGSGGKRK